VTRETNKAIVPAYVEAFNRGDLETLIDLFAPEALVYGVLGWGGLDPQVRQMGLPMSQARAL